MTAKKYERLSDHVLKALTVALEQKDVAIADLLSRALEMSMTRQAGGKGFVERREFADEVKGALTQLESLRKASR